MITKFNKKYFINSILHSKRIEITLTLNVSYQTLDWVYLGAGEDRLIELSNNDKIMLTCFILMSEGHKLPVVK